MKRILVVINNLKSGGIQNSFRSFCNNNKKAFLIDVVIFSHGDEFFETTDLNIIKLPKVWSIFGESSASLRKRPALFVLKLIYTFIAKVFGGIFAHKLFYFFHKKPTLPFYDLAISYSQDNNGRTFSVGCNDFVLHCVTARKKMTFLHCDFRNYGGNDGINRKRYKSFDYIAGVSNSCVRAFCYCLPELENRCLVFKNVLDIDDIKIMAKKPMNQIIENNKKTICFIGRLSSEKGVDRIIDFCKMYATDYLFCLVGDGPLKKKIENALKNSFLLTKILMFGDINNPYPIISKSQYLLLPSYHECAPLVFDEASILKTPVITTATLSAKEMILEKHIGFVLPNDDNFASELYKILSSADEPFFQFDSSNEEILSRAKSNVKILMRIIGE